MKCANGKMVTSPEGDGVILMGTACKPRDAGHETNYQLINKFYQLKPKSNGYFEWIAINHTLRHYRQDPIIAYIDDSRVNCYTSTTENPENTTTITTTSTTTTTTSTSISTTTKKAKPKCKDRAPTKKCKRWKNKPKKAKRCSKKFFRKRCKKTCGVCKKKLVIEGNYF